MAAAARRKEKAFSRKHEFTDDDLWALASARVVAVAHYVDQQIDPVRLVVIRPDITALETNDKGAAAGVDLAVY